MLAGLDSAYPPSAAQASAARNAGIGLWAGYLPLPGAYHGWTPQDFENARSVGATFCYAFPAAAPVQARMAAATLGAPLCLDNARGDTADPFAASLAAWLAAAAPCGMYAQPDVLEHWQGHYAFAVLATRPGGDPHSSDGGFALGVPTGNQWQGSHLEFGVTVDRGWYDPAFGGQLPTAPGAPPTPPAPPPPPAPAPNDYTVRPGDTLSFIASRFGVPLPQLEAMNPQLRRPPHEWGLIFPGDVVHLRSAPAPAPPSQPARTYVVRRGDTLSGIAGAYHVGLAQLEALNPQLRRGSHNWSLIYPGDIVRLP
jgi:LysM repeat protein